VNPETVGRVLQVWRLVTYQFLHGSAFHLLANMLGLFFLGPTLERHWGSKRFLVFYLFCGVAGGLSYYLLSRVHSAVSGSDSSGRDRFDAGLYDQRVPGRLELGR